MKDSTLTEYLNARIKTLEKENKKLRTDNSILSQVVANLKREKVLMQTR